MGWRDSGVLGAMSLDGARVKSLPFSLCMGLAVEGFWQRRESVVAGGPGPGDGHTVSSANLSALRSTLLHEKLSGGMAGMNAKSQRDGS